MPPLKTFHVALMATEPIRLDGNDARRWVTLPSALTVGRYAPRCFWISSSAIRRCRSSALISGRAASPSAIRASSVWAGA